MYKTVAIFNKNEDFSIFILRNDYFIEKFGTVFFLYHILILIFGAELSFLRILTQYNFLEFMGSFFSFYEHNY